MSDTYNPADDKETRELRENVLRQIESMTPKEFREFLDFVRTEYPDVYEVIFIDADYTE